VSLWQRNDLQMKILIAPNSFKDCMNSKDVADHLEIGLKSMEADIQKSPLADGGDGTLNVIMRAAEGTIHREQVSGPLSVPIETEYGVLPDGTAVVELARICGIALLPEKSRNPMETTTYGVGQLIRSLASRGVKKVILGAGGSCTCDGGAGLLAALGARFLDKSGHPFTPVGRTLSQISTVSLENIPELPEIIVLSDVANPLLGPEGAARKYAPQKGASAAEVETLESGLAHFVALMGNRQLSQTSGMGAAGGVPFGLSFVGARVVHGAEFIMGLIGFEEMARETNILITGEGEINTLTKNGKVVWEVMRFGKTHHIPVIAVVGRVTENIDEFYESGLTRIFSLTNDQISTEYSISHAPELLQHVGQTIAELLRTTVVSPRQRRGS
jgi:glycerate kinase